MKHYSPYIETYLFELDEGNQSTKETLSLEKERTILIDFGEMTKRYADKFLAYLSLSDKGDMLEAMSKFYDTLRKAEDIPNAKTIVIVNLQSYYDKYKRQIDELPEFLETVYDKSFRSASGKKLLFDYDNGKFYLKS